jgi:hypothetical protein
VLRVEFSYIRSGGSLEHGLHDIAWGRVGNTSVVDWT